MKKKRPQVRAMIKMLLGSGEDPAVIARGCAVGFFVALSPLLGLHTVMSIALAFLLRANRLAAILASWVCNPFTLVPMLYFEFKVGELLLGETVPFPENIKTLSDIFHASSHVALPLLVGGHLAGLVAAVVSYPIVKLLVVRARRQLPVKGAVEK